MNRISDTRFESDDGIGFIEVTDRMGDDVSILRAARVSTGADVIKGEKQDKGLIEYLYIHQHESPIEMPIIQFHIKAPIFVCRQLVRHRTQSMNEMSGRYRELPMEFFIPKSFRANVGKNKQASEDVDWIEEELEDLYDCLTESYDQSKADYEALLGYGVAREQARMVLPVSTYTEWFFQMNLRNLFHMLELRTHSHAQYETREYAIAIHEMLKSMDNLKWIVGIFSKVLPLKWLFTEALATKNFDALQGVLNDFIGENTK